MDGDFGTVAVLVVARVRPGQGSEEAYDAVAPAVGIYAQLRRSNKDGRKKERGDGARWKVRCAERKIARKDGEGEERRQREDGTLQSYGPVTWSVSRPYLLSRGPASNAFARVRPRT